MFGDDDRSVRPFQLVLIVARYLQRKLNGTIQLERKGMGLCEAADRLTISLNMLNAA